NEVRKLADGQTLIDGLNAIEIGEPLAYFRGAEYAGVDPANGDALFYRNTKDENGNIIDRSTTNNFNEATFVNIGNPTPDFVGGMSHNFSYKGIELGFTVQLATGHQIMNQAGRFQESPGWFDNQSISQLDRWQQPGDITDVPRLVFLGGNGDQERNSRYVQNASYLKMRDITLGYRFPSKILDKLKMSSLRVYVSARNLFTITGYDGWDPEVTRDDGTTATNVSNINIGTDFYSAPLPRSFTFGVNFGF
ncbi:MAG: SusC/RagA family TonB-linked outer membrane protein, partial [Bacteroidota bacterium]